MAACGDIEDAGLCSDLLNSPFLSAAVPSSDEHENNISDASTASALKSSKEVKRSLLKAFLKKPLPSSLQSVTKVFRVGKGPSSSHTMGPKRAAGTNFKPTLFFHE